jgi:hypothetical protein
LQYAISLKRALIGAGLWFGINLLLMLGLTLISLHGQATRYNGRIAYVVSLLALITIVRRLPNPSLPTHGTRGLSTAGMAAAIAAYGIAFLLGFGGVPLAIVDAGWRSIVEILIQVLICLVLGIVLAVGATIYARYRETKRSDPRGNGADP